MKELHACACMWRLLCVSGKLGCCSLFGVDSCKDQASALSHRHMWVLLCSKSFYRFILTNFVECFVLFFFLNPKPETDVTNCVQMLHLRTQVCFHHLCTTMAESSTCVLYYLSIYLAFGTGAKELMAKELIAKEIHYFCFCCWSCKHVFVLKNEMGVRFLIFSCPLLQLYCSSCLKKQGLDWSV